jgi:hypothetical protein
MGHAAHPLWLCYGPLIGLHPRRHVAVMSHPASRQRTMDGYT